MKILLIDIGVHAGLEIQRALRELNDYDVDVIGIEASPSYYTKAIRKFKNANVKMFNLAISDGTTDKIKLFIANNNGLGSSIYSDKRNVTTKSVEVDASSFSDFYKENVNGEYDIKIIKVNIEGAEYDLIKDMDENDLYKEFDLFLGPDLTKGWTKDMGKVTSLQSKIDESNEILEKHNITIKKFVDGFSDCIDLKAEVEKL